MNYLNAVLELDEAQYEAHRLRQDVLEGEIRLAVKKWAEHMHSRSFELTIDEWGTLKMFGSGFPPREINREDLEHQLKQVAISYIDATGLISVVMEERTKSFPDEFVRVSVEKRK